MKYQFDVQRNALVVVYSELKVLITLHYCFFVI